MTMTLSHEQVPIMQRTTLYFLIQMKPGTTRFTESSHQSNFGRVSFLQNDVIFFIYLRHLYTYAPHKLFF